MIERVATSSIIEIIVPKKSLAIQSDIEVNIIRYSSKLLDTFDELGREFILAHGKVEFVDA